MTLARHHRAEEAGGERRVSGNGQSVNFRRSFSSSVSSPFPVWDNRCGSGTERKDRSFSPWGDGRTRSGLLRDRLWNDRLFSLLDVRPYLLHRSLPLGGNYIISRSDIKANRCVTNRGVAAHQLPVFGIDLHGAATEHRHAVILKYILFAIDSEDAPWGKHRWTNNWELVPRRGRIHWGVR